MYFVVYVLRGVVKNNYDLKITLLIDLQNITYSTVVWGKGCML